MAQARSRINHDEFAQTIDCIATARSAQSRCTHSQVSRIRRDREYRHVYSNSGGAQYGQAHDVDDDLIIVYAEAFERDNDPDDFSLTAILAHECGHQMLVRHAQVAKHVAGRISTASEEILASILGSLVCTNEVDRDNLILKAVAELVDYSETPDIAVNKIEELRTMFEALL